MIKGITTTILLFLAVIANSPGVSDQDDPLPYEHSNQKWVDSLMQEMTLEEKIGQLFMVAAYSNRGEQHKKAITQLINQHHIGGLIFFQGTPHQQIKLTNHYQKQSDVPLLIGMDAEWGLSMRLDSVMQFPHQMTLGALQNDTLIYQMGTEIARQCRRLGVHVNFAPVVDINNNPQNPVIHTRSFGEGKTRVSNKGVAYMQGMQDHKVLGVAKHFPGHGDTDKDSHKSLPLIPYPQERLDTLELVPFKKMINKGVGGVMAAHLAIPAYGTQGNEASSLTPDLIKGLLKGAFGYNGLVFTDALNMKGVSKYFESGEVDLKAFKAGNDVLLFPEDVPKAVSLIKAAIKKGDVEEATLDQKVRKLLKAKAWAGLDQYKPVKKQGISKDLHTQDAKLLKRNIVERSLTLLENQNKALPISDLKKLDIASIALGTNKKTVFQEGLDRYGKVHHFQLESNANEQKMAVLQDQLSDYDIIIASTHGMSPYNVQTFGLEPSTVDFANEIISNRNQTFLVNFGSPYALSKFQKPNVLIQAYEEGSIFQDLASQAIFGAVPMNGKLPVSVKHRYEEGYGLKSKKTTRLEYSIPEAVNIDKADLKKVDSIANVAIDQEATPGCQVLVAKEGKVIYQKAFGHHTYDGKKPVKNSDIYDIASITKMAGTLLPVMRFYDIGLLDLDKTLGDYLTVVDSTKAKLKLRELLTHQAGLVSWIPFYEYTLTEEGFCDSNYCYNPNKYFSIQVANDLYLQETYRDTIWKTIHDSEVKERGEYRYSDLGFFYLKRIVDSMIRQDFKDYLSKNFYEPMGMNNTGYLPREKFKLDRIVPTEDDDYFRNQLIHGYVHDPAAAMLGGVAGNAGLFSNANEMAKLMQMFLNKGTYGGERYFSWQTIKTFTKKQFEDNRKGLGFDKPETDPEKISPSSWLASDKTFGHTGFTGTCVWADPQHELTYVFLSNRVHPTSNNRKLVKMDIRTDIQKAIYESFLDKATIEERLPDKKKD